MHNFFDSPRRKLLLQRALIVAVIGVGVLLFLRRDIVDLVRQAPSPAPSSDRMAAELLRADERAGICSAANAVGVGLRGEYFSEPSLQGDVALVRVDGVVDFDSSMDWPAGLVAQPASVRWSGWVKPPLSGGYRFHADAPHMKVLVARNVVAGEGASPDDTVDLAAGRFYPIEIIVTQLTSSDKRIRLEWTAPHGARYVVSKALLHLPTDTIATPQK